MIPALLAALLLAPDHHCSTAITTVDMVECIGRSTTEWDELLNTAYREALARVAEPQQARLRGAQRAWILYRDANCRAYGAAEGTISAIAAASCLRDMTQSRAEELQRFGAGEN